MEEPQRRPERVQRAANLRLGLALFAIALAFAVAFVIRQSVWH